MTAITAPWLLVLMFTVNTPTGSYTRIENRGYETLAACQTGASKLAGQRAQWRCNNVGGWGDALIADMVPPELAPRGWR